MQVAKSGAVNKKTASRKISKIYQKKFLNKFLHQNNLKLLNLNFN